MNASGRVERVCRRLLGIGVLVVMSSGVPDALPSGESHLSLFQLIARSSLVVHVRTREGALKYAVVEVLESLKGEPPEQVLRIAFRDLNWRRRPGQDPVVFPDGQEEILFLEQDPRARRKAKYRDLYTLFRGRAGRITVPAEGADIPLEAIRSLVGLTRLDPSSQAEGLLALLTSSNPYMSEAALDEVARLRAATIETLSDLISLLGSPAPGVRIRSLRLFGQVFSASAAGRVDEADPGMRRTALQEVIERARNDPDAAVRVGAVAAMARWPRFADIESELRAIADFDREQMVRYEAERALFRRAGEGA